MINKAFTLLLGCFVSAFCFSQEQLADGDPCYDVKQQDTIWQTTCTSMEQLPEYIGGDEALYTFLKKEISYPKTARKSNSQGKVFITFIIDKSGEVIDVEIHKRAAPNQVMLDSLAYRKKRLAAYKQGIEEINEEALRVIRLMPKWKPGIQDGKAVKVRYILPINFKLT